MRIPVRFAATFLALSAFMGCSKEIPTTDYQTIPVPDKITLSDGEGVVFDSSVKIFYSEGDQMKRNARFMAEYAFQATGRKATVKKYDGEDIKGKAIILKIETTASSNTEGYRIEVGGDRIVISSPTPAGVFYGIQTVRKNIAGRKEVLFPAASVSAAPRFAYRGMHLDVSRHFFTVEEVKTYIDMLALHGINRFHWHLTDDQGWRVEIRKYPKLTEVGSQRSKTVIGHNSGVYDETPHGGFYTQKEIAQVVAYAAERYITIVPEIDLPGHMLAALAAYPKLGCTGGPYEVASTWGIFEDVLCPGKEKTMEFIKDVLNEIMDLFPGDIIHIGGDECPKTQWEKCPDCQALIKKLGIRADANHTAEQKLQSYVTNFAEKVINERGRKLIGWDEILEGGLAPNAMVMSWRGVEGGIEAAKLGHDAVMVPTTHLYFDYYQSEDRDNEPEAIGGYVPVSTVYSYEPVPDTFSAEEASHIIGVQANIWSEYIPHFSQIQYMVLPRMAALAEIQWCPRGSKDYDAFIARCAHLQPVYDQLGYSYATHIFRDVAE